MKLLVFLVFFCCQIAVEAKIKVQFSTKKIVLGSKIILVELANTPQKRAQGLMFRKKLNPDQGMLFIFPDQKQRVFWMKNTLIPLSIGFFNANKTLVDVQKMQPASLIEIRPPTYNSRKPAKFALEVNINWFSKNKIKLGQKFRFLKEESK